MKNIISQTMKCIAFTESKKNKTMGKFNRILTLMMVTVATLAMVSCVQDDDFTVPASLGNEENKGLQDIMQGISNGSLTEVSIAELLALYTGQVTAITSDIVVKGYVTSSDATGNFYKEFYMQDAPENPTAAVGIVLNQTDSYNQFNKGREIYIKLNGLFLGENSSEVLTIGGSIDDDEVGELTAVMIPNHVFRSGTTMEIVPLSLEPSDVNSSHMGMFVTFENVQFPMSLEGKTFLDPNDDFDTQRTLVSCTDGSEFPLETSSFASFTQVLLPTDARGAISGVITQSYGGNDRVMVLNSIDDINFNSERCDPVFEESFNTAVDNTTLNISGWTNYAEAGSTLWTEQVYSGNGYAEFTPYSSGDTSSIGWLISPAIDMDAQTSEILTFQTEHAYPDAGHEPLEVLISTNWDGTEGGVATATWTSLDYTSSLEADYGTWFSFVSSGSIDLSGYSGTAHIAFKYTGSDTANLNTTIHVDNVVISVQ
ncbi:DUF5689 domain-containing protein [Pontimicrobium aquaticum]|uniref:DUF5689 domain-containing protein n=1 Tax=Pontimicrobium aquaticum TaxID=2565367 RepID=A0A4U0F143_9FLAO|nr:DUF5689 domain-containing protein [Pontimicrobium aquaticum]TJY38093.1 hypothetical protein E5167_02220 [Pontimicrobium aquaticum]